MRVQPVVAVENNLEKAAAEAILGAELVQFEGSFFRKDIAKKGIQRLHPKGMTYKSSGVDIKSADELVEKICSLTKKTRRPENVGGIGGFGGIFDLTSYTNPYLVSNIATIGDKLKVATECSKFKVAGVDLVANAVNEIICCGAEPLFFLDTFTCGKLDVNVAAEVISGIAEACKEANCSLIGGETAEMPGMYADGDFDLTGFGRGAVEKSCLLPRKSSISAGDVAIALLSSNLNSNSFRIMNKLISKLGLAYNEVASFDMLNTIGDALTVQRNIYVQPVLPLMRKGLIKAAAYINHEGLIENAKKILPQSFSLLLDGSRWTIPTIYKWIGNHASLNDQDMVREMNLGIDMILIVDKNVASDVLAHLNSCDVRAASIGSVQTCTKGHQIVEIINADIDLKEKNVPKKKVAILTSNKGTNLEILVEYTQNPDNVSAAEIAIVISEQNGTNLEMVKAAQIPVKVLDPTTVQNYEVTLNEVLKSHNVEIICLDVYSNELSREFLDSWKGCILNVRPSILPAFHCQEPHEAVLAFGARITGCSVYLVESDGLAGKIIEQAAVNINISDNVDALHEKVIRLQHIIYPKALEYLASGKKAKRSDVVISKTSNTTLTKLNEDIHALMKSTARPGFEDFTDSSINLFNLKASSYQYPYLISGTDGVGTKLKIAQILNKHDTIGIDLVAMCVNDILTHGAEPLFFLGCFDCGKIDEKTVKDVISGIAEGCKQAECALIGAEVNEMPDIYLSSKECLHDFNTYDVVGYAEGALQKEHLLPRLIDIKDGDLLIGLSSSGVHSNGYSLVRRLVKVKNLRYEDPFPLDKTQTLGQVLLTPTKIYVQSILPLMKKGYVKAAAHITGGGLTLNIPRVLPSHLGVVLDGSMWDVPLSLQWIAQEGQISEKEMLKTFNCGLGMVLIVDQKHEQEVLKWLLSKGERATTVGYVKHHSKGHEQVEVKNFRIPAPSAVGRKKRVGVLVSGSGTNLQALIDYTQDPNNCSSAEIVLVVSNVHDVEGLKRAERANIRTEVLSHKQFKKRVEFDMAVHALLKKNDVEIVCLAGFMRILSKEFVQLWKGHLLNMHPSILPSFKGMNAHQQVLEMGAKITGCTVHFVEAEVDAGAIIEQAAIQVDPNDTEKTLQAKVKVMEHKIFPTALELVASGKVSRDLNGKIKWNY